MSGRGTAAQDPPFGAAGLGGPPPATAADQWVQACQRQLVAGLDRVRAHVAVLAEAEGAVAGLAEAERAWEVARPGRPRPADVTDTTAAPAPTGLERVVAAYGLTAFERDLLLLAVGAELDARLGPLCARAVGDPRADRPTLGLALAALPDPHWSGLTPQAPLRLAMLVEVDDTPLAAARIRVDERVLHLLLGLDGLDQRLLPYVRALPPARLALPPSQRAVAAALAELCGAGLLVQVFGSEPGDRRAVVAAAAAPGPAMAVAARDLPVAPTERDVFARLWDREARLEGRLLLVEVDADTPEQRHAVGALVERLSGPVVVGGRDPVELPRPSTPVEVARPTRSEQRTLWRTGLGVDGRQAGAAGRIDEASVQFDLAYVDIADVLADGLAGQPPEQAAAGLWDRCRTRSRTRLDELAQRVVPRATWSDLVLPPEQEQILRDLVAHVRGRARVYDDWGFAAGTGRGLGITALFAGASGTGKTLAAEVVAHDLRLDLYRIDLAAVVSKWIGETEKNLRAVFDAAEKGGAVLLFDEADALFGRRGEVRDSTDRYANMEVGYLLQRMEGYRGLAVLTTNLRSALDPAFLRRLRVVVQFPFPDHAQRAAIWRAVFPGQVPLGDLDPAQLAQLNIAGGSIRNIALHAAFLAADERSRVETRHVLRAAASEYAKLEKPLTPAETRGWR